jgi:hypothetical protein
VTAEEVIASALEHQVRRLSMGTCYVLSLEQPVPDLVHHALRPGPHPVGWLERLTPSELRIRLVPIKAGQTTRALLEEDLPDVVQSSGRPSVI